MLWAISVLFLMLWFLGLIGGIGGGLAWVAFVVAASALLFEVLGRHRTT